MPARRDQSFRWSRPDERGLSAARRSHATGCLPISRNRSRHSGFSRAISHKRTSSMRQPRVAEPSEIKCDEGHRVARTSGSSGSASITATMRRSNVPCRSSPCSTAEDWSAACARIHRRSQTSFASIGYDRRGCRLPAGAGLQVARGRPRRGRRGDLAAITRANTVAIPNASSLPGSPAVHLHAAT